MKSLLTNWNKFLTEQKNPSNCAQKVNRGEIITLRGRTKVYMSDRSGKYDEVILYFHGMGSSSNKIHKLIGALQTTSVMLIVPHLGSRPQDLPVGQMPGKRYLQNIFNQLIQKNCFKGTRIHPAASGPLKAYGHSAGGKPLSIFLVRNLDLAAEVRYLDASYGWAKTIIEIAGENISKIYFINNPKTSNGRPYRNAKRYHQLGANLCITTKGHGAIAYEVGALPPCEPPAEKEKEKKELEPIEQPPIV